MMLGMPRPIMGRVGSSLDNAADFDGVNDSLSRASELVGNTASANVTFSLWVRLPGSMSTATAILLADGGASGWNVAVVGGSLQLLGRNAADVTVLSASTSGVPFDGEWHHILVSLNLGNSAQRRVYVDDVEVVVSWTTYVNSTIDFVRTPHTVGAASNATAKVTGKLAHLFLDHTYRDLAVTANRRLFIDDKAQPAAGQAGLNPIIYLPLNMPGMMGTNLGTGGNFTVNGTL